MGNYVLLLPTSEGKTPYGDSNKLYRLVRNFKKDDYFLELETDREYIYSKLIQALSDLTVDELEKLFGVKGKNLQNVIETNYSILESPTLKAIDRFSGVMFNYIKYHEMNEDKRKNFNENVIFVDAMFGLIKSTDLLPDYKLKIDSKFLNVKVINFWKEKLIDTLKIEFENKIVLDILPQAHKKIIDYTNAKEYYSIIFMDEIKGKLKQAGHNSKLLKGEIVNYIVDKEEIDREYLENFSHSLAYKFDKELSSKNKLIYLKKFKS